MDKSLHSFFLQERTCSSQQNEHDTSMLTILSQLKYVIDIINNVFDPAGLLWVTGGHLRFFRLSVGSCGCQPQMEICFSYFEQIRKI